MAIGVGIITGLLGSISTNVFAHLAKREDRKANKDKYEHTEKLWGHEKELLTLQSQAKVAETEQEVLLKTVDGSYQGLNATVQAQNNLALGGYKWAITLLSLFRPIVTAVLIYITCKAALNGLAATELAATFDLSDDKTLASVLGDLHRIADSNPALVVVFNLTEMAVAWWFGDRSTKRALQHSSQGGQLRAAGGSF